MLLPDRQQGQVALGAVLGAFAPAGGLDELQHSVLRAVASSLLTIDLDTTEPAPLSAGEVGRRLPERSQREAVMGLLAVLELVAHPLAPAAAESVERYARELGVHHAVLDACRHMARRQLALMYADFQRSSWYTHQAVAGSLHGRFLELVRSKAAYTGVAADRTIAAKWEGLRECPEGSWGNEVARFYKRHSFPFPGERHGISELGAHHDWVHVLADYEATPEGEIEVFGFIAASMPGAEGLSLLGVTMGIFQNDSIHHVAGKRVAIARADTLSEAGVVDAFADALRRGWETTADVMGGLDHFDWADVPLTEARRRLGVVPKAGDSPGT